MNGILNINKPPDITSFKVVSLVKRLSGEPHVGHAGTLDPQATGVLPVCLGKATRIVEYLFEHSKTYRAEIELGVTTDTYDAWGKIVQRGDSSRISHEDVLSALNAFKGTIQQTPPMYSAVKHNGKPLYQLARNGATVERKSREARVYSISLLDWRPPVFTLDVECGKGTYIRSIAHDLGQLLGCGAILKTLVRLKYGPFDIRDALSVTRLEEAVRTGNLADFLYPVDYVLMGYPAIVVGEDDAKAVCSGIPLDLSTRDVPAPSGSRCRVYTRDGCFMAVLDFNAESGKWQPVKVFATSL